MIITEFNTFISNDNSNDFCDMTDAWVVALFAQALTITHKSEYYESSNTPEKNIKLWTKLILPKS